MVSHPFVQYQNKHLNASHTHLDTKQAGIANQEQRTGTASIWVAYCYCSSLCQDYEAKTHKMWNARATAYSQSNTLSNNRAASIQNLHKNIQSYSKHILSIQIDTKQQGFRYQFEWSRCVWIDSFWLVRTLDTLSEICKRSPRTFQVERCSFKLEFPSV